MELSVWIFRQIFSEDFEKLCFDLLIKHRPTIFCQIFSLDFQADFKIQQKIITKNPPKNKDGNNRMVASLKI